MTKLNDYLAQNAISMTSFARTIGTTTATISRAIDGLAVPRKSLMERIHRATDGQVTPNDLIGLHYPESATDGENNNKGDTYDR